MRTCSFLFAEFLSGGTMFAEELESYFGWRHISIGELFREELASGSNLAAQFRSYTDSGKLVPTNLQVEIIKKSILIDSLDILIIGYPRDKEQYDSLMQTIEELKMSVKSVWCIKHLDIDYIAKKDFEKNKGTYLKYEGSVDSVKVKIENSRKGIEHSISLFSNIETINTIEIDFEMIHYSKDVVKEIIEYHAP